MHDETTLSRTALAQFTGTETWYRHRLNACFLFTDGVKYVADKAGAYWLIDEIALAQMFETAVKGQEFQAWKLAVEDSAALLSCTGDNDRQVFRKVISFTDFPGSGITFFYRNNVLMLPSEY